MDFNNIKPRKQSNNATQGIITVFYFNEFHAITLPFLAEEVDIEADISATCILSLSDSKCPEGLLSKDTTAIIEHMLVARKVAYNVVSVREIASEDDRTAYSVTITLPSKGNTPLIIDDNTILLERKDAHGLDAVTLVSKDAPHHYHHLSYGERPATLQDLKRLSKKASNNRL